MKNLNLFLGSVAVAAIMFTSCEKDKSNPVAVNGSATISGIAYVDTYTLNDTNSISDWDQEFVPAGTVIFATLSSEDLVLVPNGNATYSDIIVETTVGANGAYTLTVPANTKNFTVTITADDFTAELTEGTVDDQIKSQQYFKLTGVEVGNIHNGADRKENLYFE